jgi:hypothetical protein
MNDATQTILKECAFVNGGRGSGKTNLSMLLTDILLKHGIQIKVIDSSRQWLKHSSVPVYIKVKRPYEYKYFAFYDLPNVWNCIYDCSRLSTSELREFTTGMMANDFREAVTLDEQGIHAKAVYVLEECQNLVPNGSLRANTFQEVSRFVTQGRNFGLAYIAITQRLASVDTNLVEISGLKYFGKTEGENSVRKAKAWLPKEWVRQLRDFKTGQFLMQYGSNISLEQTPLFRTVSEPVEYSDKPKPNVEMGSGLIAKIRRVFK